jgi:hypothetical protein
VRLCQALAMRVASCFPFAISYENGTAALPQLAIQPSQLKKSIVPSKAP